jgi:hypothetical protein
LQLVPKVALQIQVQFDQQQLQSHIAKIAKKSGNPAFAEAAAVGAGTAGTAGAAGAAGGAIGAAAGGEAASPSSSPSSMVPTNIRTGFQLDPSTAAGDLRDLNVSLATGIGLLMDPHPLLSVASGPQRAIDIIHEEMAKGEGSAGEA